MIPLHKQSPAATASPALELIDGGQTSPARPARRLTFLLPVVRALVKALPAGLPMWLYTSLLKPRVLRRWSNAFLLKMIPEQVQVNGVTVVLNPADPVVSSALSLGVYESFETKLIARLVKPGMRVLDIGANVGYYTALLAKQVGPRGSVIAFEPAPANYAVLGKTVQANSFGNVRTVQGAVSESSGESFLFLAEQNGGDHRLYATEGRAKIAVPILSIDQFLPSDTYIDFVKMDIQGSEGLAIRGMQETLRRSPDAQILMEFWPAGLLQAGVDPTEFLTLLQDDLDFTLWEVNELKEELIPVSDTAALIARNLGRSYTNLYCARSGPDL